MIEFKKIIDGIVAVLLVAVLSGCNKFLSVEPHIMTEDQFYTSEEKAQQGLNGVYGVLNSWQLYGCNLILDLNYNTDLNHYMSTTNASMKGACFELDANSEDVYEVWTWLYKGVNNANDFIAKMSDSEYDPDGSLVAQARFLRGYYYFLLAQNFLNVPLRTESTQSYENVKIKATSQYEVLKYAVSEMEASLEDIPASLEHSPSYVTKTTVQGILARVYLFMAGASVECENSLKHEYYGKARDCCKAVIESGKHRLNPDYTQIFINMIGDKYDTEYHESMWEVEFLGDRSSPDYYGNSRWGELNGLRCSAAGTDYASYNVNYSYGLFSNTIKIWNLYMDDDRVKLERSLSVVTDKRQEWNIPPFNYNGSEDADWLYPYGGDPEDVRTLIAGIDRTPYHSGSKALGTAQSTNENPLLQPAGRNIGKFRREVQYEGRKLFKCIWCGVNCPLLRYADVLLMYAEAVNEYDGHPNEEIYNMILPIRNRAGIQSNPYSKYDTHDKFLKFIQNERARELCFEGLRKYDLVRWGIYLDSMKEVMELASRQAGWANTYDASVFIGQYSRMSEKNNYFPIPSLELAVNTELKQNPLW